MNFPPKKEPYQRGNVQGLQSVLVVEGDTAIYKTERINNISVVDQNLSAEMFQLEYLIRNNIPIGDLNTSYIGLTPDKVQNEVAKASKIIQSYESREN